VVVGKPDKQTPVFSNEMQEIVFNPYWYVPNSIKVQEIAPYLYQGGGLFGGGWDTSVLLRHNLHIRGVNGRDIDPETIDWGHTDIRRYEFYQPPGPDNVLGTMKFRFPNKHDVYLHDTTQKNLFAKTVRAESHGCMRVQYPDQLATVLLHHDQGWTAARVAATVQSGGPDDHVELKHHIPVYITYFTAKVNDDGSLSTFRDLYGHDARMIAALNGEAVPVGLPGSDEEIASESDQQPVFRRGRSRDAFNDFTRALFGF
jgi:murein L,D-transpeptidase YcbB/YkuD